MMCFFLDPSSWFIVCHMCWDVLGTSLKLRHPLWLIFYPSSSLIVREREGEGETPCRMLQTVGQTVAATGAASVKLGWRTWSQLQALTLAASTMASGRQTGDFRIQRDLRFRERHGVYR